MRVVRRKQAGQLVSSRTLKPKHIDPIGQFVAVAWVKLMCYHDALSQRTITADYDTATGRHVLIPQGSRLLGTYDSVIAFGQKRALVIWQRLVFPDGSSIVIDNLPATDRAGYAGLQDEVDFHTWSVVKGIALSTLFSVGGELAFGGESDLIRAMQRGSKNSINRAGERLVERQINVQPTITIRPGYPLRVIVYKDLMLKPFDEGKAQQ